MSELTVEEIKFLSDMVSAEIEISSMSSEIDPGQELTKLNWILVKLNSLSLKAKEEKLRSNKKDLLLRQAKTVEEFFIFYDEELMENNPDLENPLWAFVDPRNGHMEHFETEKEAEEYLIMYFEEAMNNHEDLTFID